jgi:hypothetical protein
VRFCRFPEQRDDGLVWRAAPAPQLRMALDAEEEPSARHLGAFGDAGIGSGGADDKPALFQRRDQGGERSGRVAGSMPPRPFCVTCAARPAYA